MSAMHIIVTITWLLSWMRIAGQGSCTKTELLILFRSSFNANDLQHPSTVAMVLLADVTSHWVVCYVEWQFLGRLDNQRNKSGLTVLHYVRPFVHKKFFQFQRNLECRWRDDERYIMIYHMARSKVKVTEVWKLQNGLFQSLSPPLVCT